ncbi:LpxI family protein [Lutimaribacter marinistellae]|uniref:LpxI family protein n=1 Tax=Lutimaribacter marinistellae TaxID=1820329 RepID=A0ABV7TMX4_9RHOB
MALALIAGEGALPAEVVRHQSEPPLICGLEGFAPDDLSVDLWFRIETLGTLLRDLKERGVERVCMAGATRRPEVDPSRIDAATMRLVPRLQKAILAGDDGALRAVVEIFEEAGFVVSGAHEIAPAILPPVGCLTEHHPEEQDIDDAARAAGIVRAMSSVDVGQACVVLRGQALAIESLFGTDWMLRSLTLRPDAGGGVLFKAPKPDQDRRVDLPTIGPDTVNAAVAAGLSGIVIEKGGVIVLDREAVVAECNALGLFLMVRERAS